jgi:hypothetical protein
VLRCDANNWSKWAFRKATIGGCEPTRWVVIRAIFGTLAGCPFMPNFPTSRRTGLLTLCASRTAGDIVG